MCRSVFSVSPQGVTECLSLQVILEYAAVDVQVVIAGCSRNLLSDLDSLQFFSGVMTPEMVFPTVHDAALSCQRSHPAFAPTKAKTPQIHVE
ncbi:prestin-like [Notothenia coriiceps]|uniref:Prestin-like n=1 Tax=Notothenia coriiceps TaxID=8208 RepID=A0A6I9NSG6_9TELE|nr:PREDICTED: prestin-like [Notothenia coriiceps]